MATIGASLVSVCLPWRRAAANTTSIATGQLPPEMFNREQPLPQSRTYRDARIGFDAVTHEEFMAATRRGGVVAVNCLIDLYRHPLHVANNQFINCTVLNCGGVIMPLDETELVSQISGVTFSFDSHGSIVHAGEVMILQSGTYMFDVRPGIQSAGRPPSWKEIKVVEPY